MKQGGRGKLAERKIIILIFLGKKKNHDILRSENFPIWSLLKVFFVCLVGCFSFPPLGCKTVTDNLKNCHLLAKCFLTPWCCIAPEVIHTAEQLSCTFQVPLLACGSRAPCPQPSRLHQGCQCPGGRGAAALEPRCWLTPSMGCWNMKVSSQQESARGTGTNLSKTRQKHSRESLCTTGSGAGQGMGLGKTSLPVLLHHTSPVSLF